MKPTYVRRRHRPSTTDVVSLKKDNQKEQQFFGETTHEPFFKPAATMQPVATVQRKCADCENEDKVHRSPEKKEEEKVQRMPEKKEEEKVQRSPDKKEEEKVMKKEDKKEEEKIQKKEATVVTATTCATASNYIGSISGKGQSMNTDTQSFYESRMGADFSNVKIHTGKEAAESAKGINAKAYTIGNNIVFNEGQYNTESGEGKKLIAHELAHVQQQKHSVDRKVIQRAMKFELQTSNILWRNNGKVRKKLTRKWGPHDYLHKGKKGKAAKGKKEGTAIELQSEEGGFVEFETPKWFSNWCELKERIQEAVDMVDEINKAPVLRVENGHNIVAYPFDTKRLLKAKKFPLKKSEKIEVEIADPTWEAKIQASEGIELEQYASLLAEHEVPGVVTKTVTSASGILSTANTAGLPANATVNLLGFLQMIVNYIERGQQVNLRGNIAKAGFLLMSRTSFSSIYRSLLSPGEKKLFKKIVKDNIILNEFGLDRKSKFFIDGHGSKHHHVGPTVYRWLKSIMGKGKDLLSHPEGGSEAMGKFDVIKKKGEKDTKLVKFEARGSETHGDVNGEMIQPASNWVSFIESIFKQAFIDRSRTGSTKFKYDPSKCP